MNLSCLESVCMNIHSNIPNTISMFYRPAEFMSYSNSVSKNIQVDMEKVY